MHPVHDVDALLLLALGLSAKRRPAELVDIMAATDLIQEAIPADAKLIEAFERLSRHGLIVAVESGYRLAKQPKKSLPVCRARPKRLNAFSSSRMNCRFMRHQPIRPRLFSFRPMWLRRWSRTRRPRQVRPRTCWSRSRKPLIRQRAVPASVSASRCRLVVARTDGLTLSAASTAAGNHSASPPAAR